MHAIVHGGRTSCITDRNVYRREQAQTRQNWNFVSWSVRWFVGLFVVVQIDKRKSDSSPVAGSISRYRNNSCPRLESHGCARMDRFAMPRPQNLAID